MRTSALADRVGVNPQTLRYYERRGLLTPPRRSPSGYRDYPDSALRLVRFVKRIQQLGFTLEDATELLQLAELVATCDQPRTDRRSSLLHALSDEAGVA